MAPTPAELINYYHHFKQLAAAHKQLDHEATLRTHELFTESICCYLFDLQRAPTRRTEYDLIDRHTGKKIEIKGTTSLTGLTTINPKAAFDYLYWVVLNLDHDTLLIRRIEYQDLGDFRTKHKKARGRVPINLCDFKHFEMGQFRLSSQHKCIIPLDDD